MPDGPVQRPIDHAGFTLIQQFNNQSKKMASRDNFLRHSDIAKEHIKAFNALSKQCEKEGISTVNYFRFKKFGEKLPRELADAAALEKLFTAHQQKSNHFKASHDLMEYLGFFPMDKKEFIEKFDTPAAKKDFSDFIEQNQKAPYRIAPNVTVLAANSQHSVAFLDIFTPSLIRNLKTSSSIPEAFRNTAKRVFTAQDEKGLYLQQPGYQKAVLTKRDEKETAGCFQRADNKNPNVKRVVILLPTLGFDEDNSKVMHQIASDMKTVFVESSPAKDVPEGTYRADKIIMVKPPTADEIKSGITFEKRVEEAYKQAEKFVESEKENAFKAGKDPTSLVFEGFGFWVGHGNSSHCAGDLKPDDLRLYEQGSMDFKFWNIPEKDSLTGKQIDDLDKKHLGGFKHFFHAFESCYSGSKTAQITPKLSSEDTGLQNT